VLENTQKWVADSLAQLHLHAGQLAVFVVANIKNVTVVQDDYPGFSVQNDYMTERVIHEIVQSVRNIGSYVELFVGEDEFIRAVLSGAIESVDRPHKLVLNLAQSGTGPARKSLVPCFCNLHRLPYCNSDGHVVALLRHKYHATSILRDHGITVPRTWLYQQDGEWLNGARPPDGLKVIVKPTYEAASIGMSRDSVRPSDAELDSFAFARAQLMRQPLTVQEFVYGYDIDVPVYFVPRSFAPMAVGVSVGGRRNLGADFLDFDTLANRSYDFFPFSEIDASAADAMCRTAERAAQILGLRGYGRIDFRINDSGQFYLIDMQTMPDIHSQSSVQYALTSAMVSAKQFYPALLAINCRSLSLF
jgi:D-alanine-D-alanine ligase